MIAAGAMFVKSSRVSEMSISCSCIFSFCASSTGCEQGGQSYRKGTGPNLPHRRHMRAGDDQPVSSDSFREWSSVATLRSTLSGAAGLSCPYPLGDTEGPMKATMVFGGGPKKSTGRRWWAQTFP